MDIENVRNLVQLMKDNDLAELEVQDGETRILLKRRGEMLLTGVPAGHLPTVLQQGLPQSAAGLPAEPAKPKEDENLRSINSPMVGTFYSAHDPESPPYVQAGTEVEPDTVVCIIEAMKVFNEIKAEVSGVVEAVLVRNEDPVEYGQPLFKVRPRS